MHQPNRSHLPLPGGIRATAGQTRLQNGQFGRLNSTAISAKNTGNTAHASISSQAGSKT
jgi:hypothetical protein